MCCESTYMLWFKFILGLNFIFFCLKVIIIHYHTQKQKKRKFKPRIKLNHNRPFAASHSRGTKPPCWRANVALGQDKQRKLPFQIVYVFCLSCPSTTFALQRGGFVPREWLEWTACCKGPIDSLTRRKLMQRKLSKKSFSLDVTN